MRMVDADAFRKEVQDYVLPITTNNLMGAADAYHRIMHLLDDAPTIEAEPVRHGRWIESVVIQTDTSTLYDYTCSVCYIVSDRECNYCPNCGAKMDGGSNED